MTHATSRCATLLVLCIGCFAFADEPAGKGKNTSFTLNFSNRSEFSTNRYIAERMGWPVLADPRSGCRRPGRTTVAAFDALLRHDPLAAELRPEVVLRAGSPPASKVLAGWLAASGADQVAVETDGSWLDPERTAQVVVATDPGAAFQAVAGNRPTGCSPGWPRRPRQWPAALACRQRRSTRWPGSPGSSSAAAGRGCPVRSGSCRC